jgi:hypothetical protein
LKFPKVLGTLVHCVSGDMKQSRGFAAYLCKKFPENAKLRLLNQYAKGDIVAVKARELQILNVVTKDRAWHKPTQLDFEQAIKNLKKYACEKHIKLLSMPKIGSGRDGLDINFVIKTLLTNFSQTDVKIIMYL